MKFKEALKVPQKFFEISIVRSALDSPTQDLQFYTNSRFLLIDALLRKMDVCPFLKCIRKMNKARYGMSRSNRYYFSYLN